MKSQDAACASHSNSASQHFSTTRYPKNAPKAKMLRGAADSGAPSHLGSIMALLCTALKSMTQTSQCENFQSIAANKLTTSTSHKIANLLQIRTDLWRGLVKTGPHDKHTKPRCRSRCSRFNHESIASLAILTLSR